LGEKESLVGIARRVDGEGLLAKTASNYGREASVVFNHENPHAGLARLTFVVGGRQEPGAAWYRARDL
jgi:hypothetical protein